MLKAHTSPLRRSLAPTSDWILVLASQTPLRELLLQQMPAGAMRLALKVVS